MNENAQNPSQQQPYSSGEHAPTYPSVPALHQSGGVPASAGSSHGAAPGWPMGYAAPPRVAAKNPGVAAVLSAVWTGAGQIYNGQIGLGLLFMGLQVINALLMFVVIGFFTGFVTWVVAMIMAYNTAKSFNEQHGIIS